MIAVDPPMSQPVEHQHRPTPSHCRRAHHTVGPSSCLARGTWVEGERGGGGEGWRGKKVEGERGRGGEGERGRGVGRGMEEEKKRGIEE